MPKKGLEARGVIIKSIVGDTAETMLHIGDACNSFVKSIMSQIPDVDIWVAESNDDLAGAIELVDHTSDQDDYAYDIIAVPANADSFSTSIYAAIESRLLYGGILVIYGEFEDICLRKELLIDIDRKSVV